MTMRSDYAVLIPVYEPEPAIVGLAEELNAAGLPVVVVDDGSKTGAVLFAALERMAGVTLLRHSQNGGKGKALKTGLAYAAERGFRGVITADADGQHTCADILKVLVHLEKEPDCLVLGVRDVKQMVPKSRTGNQMTRVLFRLLYGLRLQDTQTGLRGIPLTENSSPALFNLRGDRYEYEMEMLIESGLLFPAGIREVPIETIYSDDRNSTSHFRPLKDGMRIYALLFRNFPKFLLSSGLSAAVDYGFFALFFYLAFSGAAFGAHRADIATVLARVISGTVNYLVNRRVVFGNRKNTRYTFRNYLLLALIILILDSVSMHFLVDRLGLPAMAMKIMVECVLYILSFSVQNRISMQRRK